MACGWELSYDHCTGSRDLAFLEGVDPEVRAQAEEMATDYLDRWTGGVFGPCPVRVRPCRDRKRVGYAERGWHQVRSSRFRWHPYLVDGRWFNGGCGTCGTECGCTFTNSIILPWPIHQVTRVVIGGEEVDPSTYRVEGSRRLVRMNLPWPVWQDLDLPDDDPGAWYVEYERGKPLPAGGKVAAGELALEYMKALCNDGTCQLPERVQTITRQGVTVGFMDKFEDLDTGRTGIWLIDSWVASVTTPTAVSKVYSPDVRRG